MRYSFFLHTVLVGIFFFAVVPVFASGQVVDHPVYSSSGLSIPRFVSLSNGETNVRVGPGREYPIKHVYKRKSLPVEVILEFENWRKIRDIDGAEGWVYHSLLSGRRFGLVRCDGSVYAYEKPFVKGEDYRAVIELEAGVQLELKECDGAWCYVKAAGFSGWIERKFIWGVYEYENFD